MVSSVITGFRRQAEMKAQIMALRYRLIVLQRTQKTKRLIVSRADRCLWVWLSRLWSGWRSALIGTSLYIWWSRIPPKTAIRFVPWRRSGFFGERDNCSLLKADEVFSGDSRNPDVFHNFREKRLQASSDDRV